MAWSVYIHITPSNKYYVGITKHVRKAHSFRGVSVHSRSWYKPSMDSIMKTAEKNKKPIVQINKDTNEIIKIFPSIKDAAIELGLDRGSITKCWWLYMGI